MVSINCSDRALQMFIIIIINDMPIILFFFFV